MSVRGGHADSLSTAHEVVVSRAGTAVLSIVISVVVMALASQVRFPVPGTEVPATLQSFAMLVVAFSLPAARAFAGMAAYLALGIAGAPVFAAGSPGIWGPTGGFLVGFVLAAPLTAYLRGTNASMVRLIASGLAGFVLLFAVGNLWRWGYWSRVDGQVGSLTAMLATGLLPFAPKALVEIVLAASLVNVVRRNGHKNFRALIG